VKEEDSEREKEVEKTEEVKESASEE